MFEGFHRESIALAEATLHVRHGGSGPPVVLLHGHPRTHATWHAVAAPLATRHTVVCPDLRGYGQSSKPETRPDHAGMSKRALAQDIVELMARLGHRRFSVVGHDRGAYVAFRCAMDHADAVERLVVMDAVPIVDALESCDARFATAWWHWFFFAEPEKPERAILADPDAWYGASPDRKAQMGDAAWKDWQAAIHDPATVHCMVEDYRAGLGIDRRHDADDRAAGRTLVCPTLLVIAERDDLVALHGDPAAIWRRWSAQVEALSIDAGHHLAEEAPEALARVLLRFLA